MTCYPDLEPDLRIAGVEFVNRDVVVDGPLVTVRGWPDNGPWMKEFVRVRQGHEWVSFAGGTERGKPSFNRPPRNEHSSHASGRPTFDS